MKLPDINLKLPDLPRPVMLSLTGLVLCAVFFGVLLMTLGKARDTAVTDNALLTAQITQTNKDINNVGSDYKFVMDNRERFEALLQSERLIPHVRRTAIRQMQTLALQHGLTAGNYDFTPVGDKAVAAVSSQVQAQGAAGQPAAYRISVESVDIKIAAALDGPIYAFLQDLGTGFPGAAIVQSIELERAPKVTTEMLDQVAKGQDSRLVTGAIKFLWRTAQANETGKKP